MSRYVIHDFDDGVERRPGDSVSQALFDTETGRLICEASMCEVPENASLHRGFAPLVEELNRLALENETFRNAAWAANAVFSAHDCGEEVTRLNALVAQLTEDSGMACESPPTGCECSGCSYARERAKAGDL